MGTFQRVVVCLACLIATGCASTFGETHYFRSEYASGAPVNYFRVTVSGSTLFSNSRYFSGYFDPEAANAYFGQSGPAADRASQTQTTSLDDGVGRQRLVMLLSSNADSIAGDIGQLADNTALMNDLTGLIRNTVTDASPARKALRIQQERAKALAAESQRLIAPLKEGDGVTAVRDHMLEMANRLGRELGSGQDFDSLAAAGTWLKANEKRLKAEDSP